MVIVVDIKLFTIWDTLACGLQPAIPKNSRKAKFQKIDNSKVKKEVKSKVKKEETEYPGKGKVILRGLSIVSLYQYVTELQRAFYSVGRNTFYFLSGSYRTLCSCLKKKKNILREEWLASLNS